MLQYKTPGYYVEQLPQQPIASNPDTALPVIIGYTETHRDVDGGDLTGELVRIASLSEYQEFYGGSAPHSVGQVDLDQNDVLINVSVTPTYFTADAVQSYFENGGRSIIILSLGGYDRYIQKEDFISVLDKLSKAQEPTLILAPDALLLPDNEYYDVQQSILQHCKRKHDRFAIIDVPELAPPADPVADFRLKIGAANLDFGAAYFPWLRTNLQKEISYKDINGKIYRATNLIALSDLTTNPAILTLIQQLEESVKDCEKIEAAIDGVLNAHPTSVAPSGVTQFATLEEGFELPYQLFKNAASSGDLTNAGKNWRLMMRYTYYLLDEILDHCLDPADPVTGNLFVFLRQIVDGELAQAYQAAFLTPLVVLDNTGTLAAIPFGATTTFPVRNIYQVTGFTWEYAGADYTPTGPDGWNDTFADYTTDASGLPFATPANGQERIANLLATENIILTAWQETIKQVHILQNQAQQIVWDRQRKLRNALPAFNNIMSQIEESLGLLPPSGAIAGLYSFTDNASGVWKAPANLRLNRVKGLTRSFTAAEQEELNVDPNQGKSINHIRAFRSKGIRVWGARTLMGNSLEWRFVSVRRLFLAVEKDLREALRGYLYEPNDRNTWVAVKGLVTSYLIRLFKAGAMSGATPRQAFFVKIGLGETMTSTDVLEGRMILQVGIAAARPAEFIVLRFIQDLEEA